MARGRDGKIHYAGPWITELEEAYVLDAVRNGFYENYKVHASRLEERLCAFLGVRHCLAVNSGTAALHLAAASLGIGEGDEVILPDISCVATGCSVAYTGATAIFVDIDPQTWCISPEAVRNAIGERTRAVMAVHWNGHPADLGALSRLADDAGIFLIEDGAPALGATYRGRKVGTFGNTAAFSFQGAKVAVAGHGGALVTNDGEVYRMAKILAAYGRTDSVMTYWSDYLGFNYGMPNLPAALATAQVERLDELVAKKRDIFAWYDEFLASVSQVRLIREPEGTRSTYCYPALFVDEASRVGRDELLRRLNDAGIDARPVQPRMSPMPMFGGAADTPVCKSVEERGVILPSAYCLEKDDIEFACESIARLVA
jgi:perosamine synthetase